MDKPLWKNANFVDVLKECFGYSQGLVCYIKRRKVVFLLFILTIYDRNTRGYKGLQVVTRGEKGLQWVRGGYKWLQGVTMGYRGLQGVTRGDRGLQGVTRGYRGLQKNTGSYEELWKLFLTRTFPDTFPWSVLHNNES